MIKATEDETYKLIKSAKTDSERHIIFDPVNRPEVANLLRLSSLCLGKSPEEIATEIGDLGSGKLKQITADALNSYFKEIRERRIQLEMDKSYVRSILQDGIKMARQTATETLSEVREAMNMMI